MFAAWKVYVSIVATTNTGPMFSQIAAGAVATEASVNRARAGILAYKATALTALSAVGVAMITHGVEGAMKLQGAMASVGIVTSATTKQLGSLRSMVMDVSGRTAQDAVTIANEMSMVARQGASSPAMLSRLFPAVAMLADTRYLASGGKSDPAESARAAMAFVHYFRSYGYKQMYDPGLAHSAGLKGSYVPDTVYMVDRLNRLMNVQGEDMTRVLNQGKYYIPMAMNLGMKIDDILAYTAVMGQTGFLRGRGGSGMGNVLLGAINATAAGSITTHAQSMRYGALYDLGMVDKNLKPLYMNDKGQIQFTALMAGLIGARAKLGPAAFGVDVYKVFGKTAEQLLMTIADPTVQQQLDRIKASMHRQGDVYAQQHKLISQGTGPLQQLTTNFNNVLIELYSTTLPRLNQSLTYMAGILQSVRQVLTGNPDLGFKIAIATVVATVATGLGAMVTMARAGLLTLQILRAQAAAGGLAGAAGAAANPAVRGVAGGVAARVAAAAVRILPMAGPIGVETAAAIALGVAFSHDKYSVLDRRAAYYRRMERNQAGSAFGSPGITINLGGLSISTTSNDPREHAAIVVREINRRIPFVLRSSGGSAGLPGLAAASIGGGIFGN